MDNRIAENREFDERDAQIMRNINSEFGDELTVENIPDGMDYFWARHSVYGDDTSSQIGRRSRLGWTPVPAYRHPEIVFVDPSKPETRNGWIEKRGLILMERPKKYGEIEMANLEKRNIQDLMGAAGNDDVGNSFGGFRTKIFRDELSILQTTPNRSFKD
jgi:hypothetical protein